MKSLIGVVLILTVATAANWSLFPQWYKEPTVQQMEDTDINSRITGGQTAARHQFPYQAALKIPSGDGKISFCGGTLISREFVLSAAHCCELANGSVEVFLGIDRFDIISEPYGVKVAFNKIISHDGYDRKTLKDDICLLKLPFTVTLNRYINIARLPKDDTKDYTGETVIASGWGLTSDTSTTISPDLQFVELKVVPYSWCKNFFRKITTKQICTGGFEGKSTCSGDSGGPLVLNNTVVGITSFGSSWGCQSLWPAVFTRVSKYLFWIKDTMRTTL